MASLHEWPYCGRQNISSRMYLIMGGGYVLKFTNPGFGQFFNNYNVDIHGVKYEIYGTSKANKMRAFWDRESDALVGKILSDMLDVYEAICSSGGREIDSASLGKSRAIVARISGITPEPQTITNTGFLDLDFELPDIHKLPVEFAVGRSSKIGLRRRKPVDLQERTCP